jgi:tetratricopeptide (TPR) repeat protein
MDPRIATTALLIGLLQISAIASAADVIVRKSEPGLLSGEITAVSKAEVTLKPQKGDSLKIPANDIASINWQGEPAGMNIARSDETGGRYQKALESYRKLQDSAKSLNENIKADLQYAIARTTGRLALSDPAQVDAAIKLLTTFKGENPDSYHYYPALNLLGQLYASKKDGTQARLVFGELERAPWKDYQMASKNAIARLALAENKTDEAAKAFAAVVALPASNPLEESQRYEAMLGMAKILTTQSKYDDALKLLDEVIAKASPEDLRVQAEAYVRQGDCLQSQGKDKDALLAYLHVDVLFASEQQLHAESLFHLTRLWAKVGQPGRAAEARERLENEFPNSEWTRQAKAPAS